MAKTPSRAPDDKTPVALTYGPFTIRKTDMGTWTLDAPASFSSEDLGKLGTCIDWVYQTTCSDMMLPDDFTG